MDKRFVHKYAKCNNRLETGDCPEECIECAGENEGADLFPNDTPEEREERAYDNMAKMLESDE